MHCNYHGNCLGVVSQGFKDSHVNKQTYCCFDYEAITTLTWVYFQAIVVNLIKLRLRSLDKN